MISGRKTLSSIERAIDDIQESENRIRKSLGVVQNRLIDLENEKTATYKQLAEHRVNDALADGLIDEADKLTEQVKNLLDARLKTIEDLETRTRKLNADRKSLTAQSENLNKVIDDLEIKLDKIGDDARAALASDPGYEALNKSFEDFQSVCQQAEEKTQKAIENRKLKGQAYEKDPLFMYLWDRKFGTKDYGSRRLIRWLDGKVANHIGYNEARANYAILIEIPVRLNEHLEKLKNRLAAEKSKLDKLVAEKIKQIAGKDLHKELASARTDQHDLNLKADQLAAELTELTGLLNHYALGQDKTFTEAVNLTTNFLQKDSLSELRRLARLSESNVDDEIIASLQFTEREIHGLERESEDQKEELEKLFRKKQELLELAANFRRDHYDDVSSEFDMESNLEVFLEELLRGAITGADYWNQARRHHKWRRRPADPYRQESSFPPFGTTTRRRSRRGRGGFETGGGF